MLFFKTEVSIHHKPSVKTNKMLFKMNRIVLKKKSLFILLSYKLSPTLSEVGYDQLLLQREARKCFILGDSISYLELNICHGMFPFPPKNILPYCLGYFTRDLKNGIIRIKCSLSPFLNYKSGHFSHHYFFAIHSELVSNINYAKTNHSVI